VLLFSRAYFLIADLQQNSSLLTHISLCRPEANKTYRVLFITEERIELTVLNFFSISMHATCNETNFFIFLDFAEGKLNRCLVRIISLINRKNSYLVNFWFLVKAKQLVNRNDDEMMMTSVISFAV
jgi:hypothetical protein